MFRCELCKVVSLPKVSPVLMVVEERVVSYLNKDSEGNDITSVGSEIVREMKVCPGCAGMNPPVEEPTPDYSSYRANAKGFFSHARSCSGQRTVKDDAGEKVGTVPCVVCERGKAFFGSLTPQALNYVLSE